MEPQDEKTNITVIRKGVVQLESYINSLKTEVNKEHVLSVLKHYKEALRKRDNELKEE